MGSPALPSRRPAAARVRPAAVCLAAAVAAGVAVAAAPSPAAAAPPDDADQASEHLVLIDWDGFDPDFLAGRLLPTSTPSPSGAA